MHDTAAPPAPVGILFTAAEAAKQLAVSPRTLWSISAPRGPLAVVRIGSAVRYARTDLEAYVARQRQTTSP